MRTSKLFATFALAAALFVSACAQQEFIINSGSGSLAKDDMHDFFVGGIGQSRSVNAAEICGGGNKVVKVETQETALNVLLDFLSLGVYSPRQYRVTCRR